MKPRDSSSGDGPHRAVLLLAPGSRPEQRARAEATSAAIRREFTPRGLADAYVDLGEVHPRELGELARPERSPRVFHLSGRLELGDEAALTVLLGRFEQLGCLILDGAWEPSQTARLGRVVEWIVRIPASLGQTEAETFAAQLHLALASGQVVNLAFYVALDRARITAVTRDQAPQLIHRGRPHLAPLPSQDPGSGELVIEMDSDERERLLQLIERSCGIASSVAADLMLERRLSPRLEALGLRSFTDYLNHIEFGPEGVAELQSAIARITTHETYLFRERYQLDAMAKAILPELARRNASTRELQLWSAGCSTGEEAYTLAILLLESGLFEGWRLRVVGSDISERVVETARAGIYGPNSFRTTSVALRDRYFVAQGRRWAVCDEVRGLCRFERHNLLDTVDRAPGEGQPDLISCRNVLIYLSKRARRQIITGFHAQMRGSGYLLLGHSETLIDLRGRFEPPPTPPEPGAPALDRMLIYRRQ